MFHHYRLSGRGYCDLWLTEEAKTVPPLVLFFDGALSIEDARAREKGQIHLPFFQHVTEDISRYAAVPFNFIVVPGDFTPLESGGDVGELLRMVDSFLAEKGQKIGPLHLAGYSKGARNCFRNLIQGDFEHINAASFSSFSGAYMFNPKLLKKPEVQNRLKTLTLVIGSGRSCPFFLINYTFHRALTDLGILHDYYLYEDHYIRSFYPLFIRTVSWLLQPEVPRYPEGKGYDESGTS